MKSPKSGHAWRNFHYGKNDPTAPMHSEFCRELHRARSAAGARGGSMSGKRKTGTGSDGTKSGIGTVPDLVQQMAKQFTDRLKP